LQVTHLVEVHHVCPALYQPVKELLAPESALAKVLHKLLKLWDGHAEQRCAVFHVVA
jgi:hypothetical protein